MERLIIAIPSAVLVLFGILLVIRPRVLYFGWFGEEMWGRLRGRAEERAVAAAFGVVSIVAGISGLYLTVSLS